MIETLPDSWMERRQVVIDGIREKFHAILELGFTGDQGINLVLDMYKKEVRDKIFSILCGEENLERTNKLK